MAILPKANTVIGNVNITSLIGNKYELVEEAKWYSLDVVGILLTKHNDSDTFKLGDGWKLSHSCVDPEKFAQAKVGILKGFRPSTWLQPTVHLFN